MTSTLVSAFAVVSVRAQPVSQPPQILQPPSSATKRAGTRVTFAVVAEGSPDLAYQWRKDGVPLADDGHFAGTGSSSLVITAAAASDVGAYSVEVANAFGVARGDVAMLAVQPWRPWRVVGSDPNTDEITRRVFVDGNRAYLANGYVYFEPTPNTGLRIVNVSDPTSPRRVGAWRANYAEASSVVVSGDRAYVALRTSPPLGLAIVDLSDETNPRTLGIFDSSATVGHGIDVAVSGTVAHAALGAQVLILDVSDPAHITSLGSWTNLYSFSRLVLSGTTAYVAGSGLQVFDLTDPTNPLRLGGVSPANVIYR
ncbi:MAG: immunoglobulin domain-containing protein [Verrucomicrobia bacterium]|nr:immunoglobulin domain-containing protein [Verrucomicrobiota bacterium]